MNDDYEPASDFLKRVAAGAVPLTGSLFAEANLRMLVDLTSDSNLSNRDWATFLLAQANVDNVEVRAILHHRLHDESEVVQEEAMVGLAIRKDVSALPVLLGWMHRGGLSKMILEAAVEFGASSLCQPLKDHKNLAEKLSLDEVWQEAWSKCGCTGISG
jgi:hypothetical protein